MKMSVLGKANLLLKYREFERHAKSIMKAKSFGETRAAICQEQSSQLDKNRSPNTCTVLNATAKAGFSP